MKKYKILSIDAWAGPCFDGEHTEETCDCNNWEWNNWFNVGYFYESEYGKLTEKSALKCLATKLSVSVEELSENHMIEDDQYNYVLINKTTNQPYYAIEYGSEQD